MSKVISLREYKAAKERASVDKEHEELIQRIRNLRTMVEEYNKKTLQIISEEERKRDNASIIKEILKNRKEQDLPD